MHFCFPEKKISYLQKAKILSWGMSDTEYLTIQIGSKIRAIRKDNDLKLGELAEKSGISIAMLSKIENGRVVPTLPTLFQILRVLKVDLNAFFSDFHADESFPGFILCKREDAQPLDKEEESVGFQYQHILNRIIERSSLEVAILTLDPGARRNKVSTSGFEYIYLISGRIRYELGNTELTMAQGDSLFFDGNLPHVPHNLSEAPAVILVFYFINLD